MTTWAWVLVLFAGVAFGFVVGGMLGKGNGNER
jgi:hypothetical protein